MQHTHYHMSQPQRAAGLSTKLNFKKTPIHTHQCAAFNFIRQTGGCACTHVHILTQARLICPRWLRVRACRACRACPACPACPASGRRIDDDDDGDDGHQRRRRRRPPLPGATPSFHPLNGSPTAQPVNVFIRWNTRIGGVLLRCNKNVCAPRI